MELQYITTTYEDNKKERIRRNIPFLPDEDEENGLVNLYPHVRYQSFEGFGGAITDSAGYVYSLLDVNQQKEIIHQYFGKENMKYNMVRIPIDSCDFSLEHYEADSDENDDSLKKFSFERVER